MDLIRRFGFLPLRLDLDATPFGISSLETIEQSIAVVAKSPRRIHGWLWPPTTGKNGFDPYPRFGVPFTHQLTLKNVSPADADALAEFMITALGFLHGIVLIPEGWGHMTRVNVDADQLCDYVLEDTARLRVLTAAIKFWELHPEHRQSLFGLMYWHCAASAFPNDHERFAWHYTVLDACWLLHARLNELSRPDREPHAERIKKLAAAYQLKVPAPWDDGKAIITIRNHLIHEARWGGKPIGFGPGPEIGYGTNRYGGGPIQSISLIDTLVSFTTRAILAILGEVSAYVQSPIRESSYLLE
jgi:hypothetical protein